MLLYFVASCTLFYLKESFDEVIPWFLTVVIFILLFFIFFVIEKTKEVRNETPKELEKLSTISKRSKLKIRKYLSLRMLMDPELFEVTIMAMLDLSHSTILWLSSSVVSTTILFFQVDSMKTIQRSKAPTFTLEDMKKLLHEQFIF
jgi:hypothetical protein